MGDVADDKKTARIVLSVLVDPNDPATGRIRSRLRAMKTLRLAAKDIAAHLDKVQRSGIRALPPGDAD